VRDPRSAYLNNRVGTGWKAIATRSSADATNTGKEDIHVNTLTDDLRQR